VKVRWNIDKFKVAKNLQNRNTTSSGAKCRAPPKAGLLLVLRCVRLFTILKIAFFPEHFHDFPRISGGGGAP
jgi:hypothetical protein